MPSGTLVKTALIKVANTPSLRVNRRCTSKTPRQPLRLEGIRTFDTVGEQFVFSSFSIGPVTWYPECQITYFAIAFVSNSFKGLNAPHCAFAFRRSTIGQNLDEK